MQLSDARKICNSPEFQTVWAQLSNNEVNTLMGHVENQGDRQECCFPYDCMHHEQCSDNPCGSCRAGANRWTAINKILDKHPLALQYAEATARVGEQQVIQNQLNDIKALEAVGDYAAAQRIWEGDDSE